MDFPGQSILNSEYHWSLGWCGAVLLITELYSECQQPFFAWQDRGTTYLSCGTGMTLSHAWLASLFLYWKIPARILGQKITLMALKNVNKDKMRIKGGNENREDFLNSFPEEKKINCPINMNWCIPFAILVLLYKSYVKKLHYNYCFVLLFVHKGCGSLDGDGNTHCRACQLFSCSWVLAPANSFLWFITW